MLSCRTNLSFARSRCLSPPLINQLTPISDLLDILPDAVLMVDGYSRILYVNPAVRTLLGYAPDELLGQNLRLLIPAPLRERHAESVASYQSEGQPMRMGDRPVLHALHRSGEQVPVSISLCNWTLEDGRRVSVAVVHNLAELHARLDHATALAVTDPLSGLGNRLRMSHWMQAALADARPFSLLYLDLRHFKGLNDKLGHAAGDVALQHLAQRLRSHVRGDDLVARVGGDEFVVLFDALEDEGLLARRAQGIAQSAAESFRVAEVAWSLGVNIGGAISPRHGRSEPALLRAADEAMYRAKRADATYRLAEG
jgi:diguanylate cyclase (GGDEF)-like protein/PAS domain S-box-containing protein